MGQLSTRSLCEPDVHTFFIAFKETLKERFQQIEFWISYQDIGRV